MNLAELRRNLEAQIREGQLPEALQALLIKLPEGGECYRIVSALITRLNAANKERFRNTISFEEYQRRVDQVSADFFDLLAGLTEADFSTPAAAPKEGKAAKTGSVLYRVPDVMQLKIATRCTIRVAVDEDAILENILLDQHVEIKSKVEISDVMSAELVDAQGGTFQITALNSRTQLIRETGFTEWNFNVTPLAEGVHQLLVKVSIMEVVPGFAEPIPREVSLLETVTIIAAERVVAEEKAPESEEVSASETATATPSAGFKSSGQQFAFQSEAALAIAVPKATAAPPPAPPPVAPSSPIFSPPPMPSPAAPRKEQRSVPRNKRTLALFLAFLVIVPAATWAIAPDLPAWVNAHYIQGTPEAYAGFIEAHPESPRLEQAFFYKAETSGRLADLRAYEKRYEARGKYQAKVKDKIVALETKSFENIRTKPDSAKIRQFVVDFPETKRLPELKRVVESRPENRKELLAEVEKAYVTAVQTRPTEQKVTEYLRDFPQPARLQEVEQAARTKPEVFSKVQPILEDAYLKKMEQSPTKIQSEQFLEKFPEPVRRDKFEKILDKRPEQNKEVIRKMRRLPIGE
jgi:hypothetical protein